MNKKEIKIDYDKSILSVSNSVLEYYKIPHQYKSLAVLDKIMAEDYQNVVLMIIDGMGADILAKNLPEDSFLRQHVITNVSSVFPPTTAAATTAYHSGLPPIASGWMGWMEYIPQYDKIIELFLDIEYYSGEPTNKPSLSENLLKYEDIYSKVIKSHPEVEFHKIFPPFEKDGVKSFDELCNRLREETRQNNNKKLFSVYWTEPDHSIHECGVCSTEVKEILRDINAKLEELATSLNDTLLIISADHGAIDVKEEMLNDYPDVCACFKRPPALESRFKTFYIKDGKQEEFKRLFEKYFGEDFVLYTKQEFLAAHILGYGTPHPIVEKSLGDFVIIGIKDKELHYTTSERDVKHMIADHAGFSKAELTVPLIIIKKQK